VDGAFWQADLDAIADLGGFSHMSGLFSRIAKRSRGNHMTELRPCLAIVSHKPPWRQD
jgi:hypothetical protein